MFVRFCRNSNRILTQVTLVAIFCMIFLSAWTTEWIGVHAIFGAFLVGIIIPRMGGITVELTHKLEDFVTVALLPLYFASSGLKTKLGLLNDWMTGAFCLLVIVVACTGKIIGCTLAARSSGFPWRESFSIGVLMNTKGLVELIVLNIGLDAGVINDRIFVVMVVMALVTTFMTSPIIAYVYPRKYQVCPVAALPKKTVKVRAAAGLADVDKDSDEHMLLLLTDMDSVPLVSTFVRMVRGSLGQGKHIGLSGLKTFMDMESATSVMVGTQVMMCIVGWNLWAKMLSPCLATDIRRQWDVCVKDQFYALKSKCHD